MEKYTQIPHVFVNGEVLLNNSGYTWEVIDARNQENVIFKNPRNGEIVETCSPKMFNKVEDGKEEVVISWEHGHYYAGEDWGGKKEVDDALISMKTVKQIVSLVCVIGQGAYVQAVAFHSNNELTVDLIKACAETFPAWIQIKGELVFTDENMFDKRGD